MSPQTTEVMQFVSSDIESLVETNGVLQGQHGTPAGKLPPLKPSVRQLSSFRRLLKNALRMHLLSAALIVAQFCFYFLVRDVTVRCFLQSEK